MAATYDAPSPIVANVLERMEHVHPSGPSGRAWRCDCPVERNGTQSHELLVTLARDGRVLLQCNGGCKTVDILESTGLKLGDLYPRGLASEADYRLDEAPNAETPDQIEGALPQAIRALDAPEPTPVEWVVRDLFSAGEIGLLVGDGGSFKSTAAIDMCAAVAGGYNVWNKFAVQRRPALIVSAEDSLDIVVMRLRAFVAGHQWDADRVLGNVHLFATTDVNISQPRWQMHLLDEAQRLDAGMIVLDPFAELINADENSNTEVRPLVKYIRALGRTTNAAIIVVHHVGKMGQDRRTLDRIRGASALPSAARSILFFDYQPNGAGVAVQHLKMSRTPRLDPFILARTVDHDRDNRAHWLTATLIHTEARAAALDRAEAWVVAQVTAAPRAHTTSDLRRLSRRTGISAEDVGRALNALQLADRIGFESGERGAKKWFARGFDNPALDLQ